MTNNVFGGTLNLAQLQQPKFSHRAKFHQDRSNQLGEKR